MTEVYVIRRVAIYNHGIVGIYTDFTEANEAWKR